MDTVFLIMAIMIWALLSLLCVCLLVICYIKITYLKWEKEEQEILRYVAINKKISEYSESENK